MLLLLGPLCSLLQFAVDASQTLLGSGAAAPTYIPDQSVKENQVYTNPYMIIVILLQLFLIQHLLTPSPRNLHPLPI